MRFFTVLLVSLVASQFMTTVARADTELTFNDGSTVLITNDKVLFGDQQSGILYPGHGNALTVIDWKDEHYMIIDEEFADSMSDQISAAMAQAEAQLAQLPPEQQAMMREMLTKNMPGGNAGKKQRSYRASGKTQSVAGFTCRTGQMLVNGQPEYELCTASAKELSISEKDFLALRAAFLAMGGIMEKFSRGSELVLDLDMINGVPVSSRHLNGDKQSELVSVSTNAIDEQRVALPAHFQQKDIIPGR